jgi:hypothetical protein
VTVQQTVNTPYFQVQAIRRALQDQGKPTFAKPYAYPVIVNFATNNAGEIQRTVLNVDSDSDFVWCSLYHYFQLAPYDPAVGSTAANNTSGQFLDAQGAFQVDIRISQLGSRRAVHDADFAFDLFTDSFYAVTAGLPGTFSDESELIGTGGIGGSDINTAISIYRAPLFEPLLLKASSEQEVAIRRRIVNAIRPMSGHVFLFSGVRLYPQGGA